LNLSVRSILVISVILVAACGGTKIEVANDTGYDFLLLEIEINGEELDWTSVDNEETVSGSLTIPETPRPPVARITWDSGINTFEEEICLLDSAATADRILIHLSLEATALSYSF
jgi:hypothetical protein